MYSGNHWCSWLVRSTAVALAILGILVALAYARYGSLEAALVNLRGESLVVVPAKMDLGKGKKNERRTIHFEIKNLGREMATVVGGSSDCSCATVNGLPLKVPPGKKVDVKVGISFPIDGDEFSHIVVFYTDVAQQGVLATRIHGQATE
jgi:hypothetical protein